MKIFEKKRKEKKKGLAYIHEAEAFEYHLFLPVPHLKHTEGSSLLWSPALSMLCNYFCCMLRPWVRDLLPNNFQYQFFLVAKGSYCGGWWMHSQVPHLRKGNKTGVPLGLQVGQGKAQRCDCDQANVGILVLSFVFPGQPLFLSLFNLPQCLMA